MATATLTAGSRVARSAPRGSVLRRIFVALHKSRMRQAQREIARHQHMFDRMTKAEDDNV